MHICVLSNSHAASIQAGYKQIAGHLGSKITIFAAPNKGMKGFKANDANDRLSCENNDINEIVRMTSGGLNEVIVADYDAFLVYGLFVIPPRFDMRHSSNFKSAVTKSMLLKSLGRDLAQHLVGMTRAPVFISPEPLLADFEDDGVTQIPKTTNAPLHPLPFDDVCEALRLECDIPNVNWIFQDPSTIGSRLNTCRFYSTNSELLAKKKVEHLVSDVRHMNAEYGVKLLETLVREVESLI